MEPKRIEQIASPEVQDFLFANEHTDETRWLLNAKIVQGLPASVLAEQLVGRRKAKDKLPSFYQMRGVVYPPRLNLEQTSSEATAQYKVKILRQLLGDSHSGADMCGGWGVDAFYLSGLCREFFYSEPQQWLMELAQHNHRRLGRAHIHYQHQPVPQSLTALPDALSFIYLDPSRRVAGKKVVRLTDYEPDVTSLLPLLFQKTAYVLIKMAPLLDITEALRALPHTKAVHVVASENECKELLFLCERDYTGNPQIHAADVRQPKPFSFFAIDEAKASISFSEPQTYLYEPGAAILKAGAFRLVAERFELAKLHANTHLYTSTHLLSEFPGRIFEITELRPAEIPNQKANVVTRNFPDTSEALKKKLRLSDGGDWYVVAFTGIRGRHVVVAKRVA
jgi:hypothetical protein